MSITADGRVVIDTSLNNQGFVRGLNTMHKQTDGLTSAVKKLGLALGAAFAVRRIIAFGKEAIALGSDVQEVQNVVDTAFGDMTYKVEAFADTAIRQFGMSRLAAKKTASTYMAMAKGMGISDEAASNMSIRLVGLTGDIASFYNISQELADTKLKSVFTGETETLKDLGVVMTQANLKAYALERGISKNIDAMTQAELVSLRYNFVLDQLQLASGDFAKTSGSWANQTRILSMQWQELMSIMGNALIRIFTPMVRVMNQIVESMISIAQVASEVISALFGSEAASGTSALEAAVENQDALTASTKETEKAQKRLTAGFDEINKLSGGAESSDAQSGGAGLGIAAVEVQIPDDVMDTSAGGRILSFVQSIKDTFDDFTSQIDWGTLKDSVYGFRDALSALGGVTFDALRQVFEDVLIPLGVWVLNTAAPVFLDGLNQGLDLLADLASVLLGEKTISELVSELTPLQTCLLGLAVALAAISAISSISATFTAITTFVKDIQALKATGLIGKLAEVIMLTASGAGTLSEAMKLVFGPGSIIAGIAAIVGGAILAVTNFFSMLNGGFSWVKEALMLVGIALVAVGAIILGAPALVAGVVAGIVAGVATAVVLIKQHWESIKAFFFTMLSALKVAFLAIVSWINVAIIAPVTAAFKTFINGLIGFVEGFVNFFVRGINKIIDAVNALSFDVPDFLGGGTLGFSLPNVKEIKLPRLAQGAVVPPNREFLAVLGDNKTETEVVSPLPTMKQALLEALQAYGGIGGQVTIVIKPAPGLPRYLKYELDAETTRRGGKLVTQK